MKIGILAHFNSFQPSYALAVGWHERAKLLEYFDQDFDFLINEGVPDGNFPHQKSVLRKIKTSKPFDERVKFFTDLYMEVLPEYDAILTADLLYQTKANFLPQNQAMRNVAPKIKAKWYHWLHSQWTQRPNNLEYPLSLKYTMMENSKIVFMNSYELNEVAKMYDTSPKNVACVYNPKDFRSFNNFHPMSWEIIDILDLQNKDAIQLFPHCSTRMDSKGIDGVIKVFSALKRAGLRVAVIFANANYRSMGKEIEDKKEYWMKEYEMNDEEDYIFTMDITEKYKPLPRDVISDLFKVANLFVFLSWRETVGNVFQEAKISSNLLVLNSYLPCLREMGGKNAIFIPYHHMTPGRPAAMTGDFKQVNYNKGEQEFFDHIAEMIIPILPSRDHLWDFSFERIWHDQLKPLLYYD